MVEGVSETGRTQENGPWMHAIRTNHQQGEDIMIREKGKNTPKGKGNRFFTTMILSIILLIAGFPFPAMAHPPKDVVLSYDQVKKVLEVRITHSTKDPASHYIKKFEIKNNGKESGVTDYQSQPGPETFSYTYPLDAAPGDVIEAKATCNIFGSKTGKLIVGK
jgi:hypothetical protein